MTRFFQFPSELTFAALLPPDFEPDGETGYPLPDGIEAMRIIGLMYRAGTFDEASEPLTAPVLLPGWHVNILGHAPEAWVQYEVAPKSPSAVFGGQ